MNGLRALAADGRVTFERLAATRDLMQRVLPHAMISGYQHRVPTLSLPDLDDRHVLAAAIEAGAEAIITFNLKDFPSAALRPYGLVARHPDEFLGRLFYEDSEAVPAVIEAARSNLTMTAPDPAAFIDQLAHQGLTEFAAKLRAAAAEK